jgi:cation diffusion facilitator CzcD-associated flavoprotein CzcO
MPGNYEKYVSKNDFVNYLQQYSDEFNIQPLFNKKVTQVKRKENTWETSTTTEKFTSQNLIIATGFSRKPLQPEVKGMENFKGEIIHSYQYKNGKLYAGKKVLVVGFGNSACEIAIDLHEYGAFPSLSVRSGVNIIPRDIAGIPIVNIVLAESWLSKISPALTDTIDKPILSLIYGNYKKYGLTKLPYGPITQITKHKRIPLLDIGTINLIKKEKIKVYPGIDQIRCAGLKFTDGREETFDAIIFATGYESAVSEFLSGYDEGDSTGKERNGLPNLYFCGFDLSPNGMLREIGIEAKRIAKKLATAQATSPS